MATGVELATAWIRLVPSAEGIEGGVGKALAPGEAEAEASGKRAGGRFSTGAKLALAAGTAAVAAGVVAVFKTGMEELKFGEEISAQTEQLVKNTGAGFSTAWIEDYTLKLSGVSGISEEELQAAGNAVLKFGDVNEETYSRAVDSINNMGAAGKSVAGVGEALGKALADPAAAAGLLKRQGVILNDEQKKLIDNLVATGDKAGAQAVILDSLETTYGGMAEAAGSTLTGSMNKLNNSWENMAGTAVEALMPAITAIVGGLSGLFSWLQDNQAVIPVIATIIGVVLVAAFFAWAASIWATTVALLANPITWIILAIVALVAAVVLLVMNWDQVVAFVTEIWSGFVSWLTSVTEGVVAWWNGLWEGFGNWIAGIWEGFVGWIRGIWEGYVNWLLGVVIGISEWWNGLWQGIGDFIRGIWESIVGWVTEKINMVRSIISIAGQIIRKVWADIWNGIVQFFVGTWNNIVKAVGNIGRVFSVVFGVIGGIVSGVFRHVVGVVRGAINFVIRLVNGAIDGINKVIGAAGAVIGLTLRIPKIPMLAKGGTVRRPGLAIVGERGPELLHLPGGAVVDPDIEGGGGGGDTNIHLEVHPREEMSEEQIAEIGLRKLLPYLRKG